jgi:hypothetical protein
MYIILLNTIKSYYQVCLRSKPGRAIYLGKLQPLHVPTEACETISMNFIEGLPYSTNASCILVIVMNLQDMLISFHRPIHILQTMWLRFS